MCCTKCVHTCSNNNNNNIRIDETSLFCTRIKYLLYRVKHFYLFTVCFVSFSSCTTKTQEIDGTKDAEKMNWKSVYFRSSILYVRCYSYTIEKKKKRCMIFGYTSVKFNITLYLLLLLLLLLCIIFTAAKYVYRYTNIKRSIATDSRFSFLQPISCTRRNWIRYAVFFVRTTSADDRTREKADSPNT